MGGEEHGDEDTRRTVYGCHKIKGVQGQVKKSIVMEGVIEDTRQRETARP